MKYLDIIWDEGPGGNVEHVRDNGLTPEEVREAVVNALGYGTSHSSGNPCLWGYTQTGEYIMVIYEQIDDMTIRVITAYVVDEPSR